MHSNDYDKQHINQDYLPPLKMNSSKFLRSNCVHKYQKRPNSQGGKQNKLSWLIMLRMINKRISFSGTREASTKRKSESIKRHTYVHTFQYINKYTQYSIVLTLIVSHPLSSLTNSLNQL